MVISFIKRNKWKIVLVIFLIGCFLIYSVNSDERRAARLLNQAEKEYFLNQNFNEAILLGNAVLNIQPDNYVAFYIRGLSKAALKDDRGALSDLEEALRYALANNREYSLSHMDSQQLMGELYWTRGTLRWEQGIHVGGCNDWKIAAKYYNDPLAIELYEQHCQ